MGVVHKYKLGDDVRWKHVIHVYVLRISIAERWLRLRSAVLNHALVLYVHYAIQIEVNWVNPACSVLTQQSGFYRFQLDLQPIPQLITE